MANYKYKVKENASGPFYVDKECISCDSCTSIARDFFSLTNNASTAYVSKQPINQIEKNKCFSALKACPVAAIGFNHA